MPVLVLVTLMLCGSVDHFELASRRPYQVDDLSLDLVVTAKRADGTTAEDFCGTAQVQGARVQKGNEWIDLIETPPFVAGQVTLEAVDLPDDTISVTAGSARGQLKNELRTLPGFVSLLPALIAIVLALFLRQALVALFAGIWLGALFIYDYEPHTALLRSIDTHLLQALADSGHSAIVLFTMALGGMVGILARSGGTRALVDRIALYARTRRSGLVTAWFTGLIIFFDDYANCLLVGNTLRPLTDRLKISREKLAYIVDSTAAPITSVALISTWVGYQIGLLDDLAAQSSQSSYDLFMDLIPYSFYSLFTIVFVLAIAALNRDYGPMWRAERRAQRGILLREGAQPLMDKELTEMEPVPGAHWSLAVVPIAAVILLVSLGLYVSGSEHAPADAGLREIIGAADPYPVLLWSAFGGSLVAAGYAVARRTLTLNESVEAWIAGCKAMVLAVLILVLAWAIGDMCKVHLQTGPWVLSQIDPSPHWIPTMTFIVCAIIAMATGSSFSTMAIVMPLAGPMAWAATGDGSDLSAAAIEGIRLATLASVLGGAVFGDHCSPISDTTIMSSMSCASDHVDHVRTQMPYALTCAGATLLFGCIPAGYGLPPWILLPVGMAALVLFVRYVGKPTEIAEAGAEADPS